jgi:outer membrane protein OmpA-like peptidoglycan-associated protein
MLAALTALIAVACGAAQPPPELVDARKAYDRARTGPASRVAPVPLDDARLALDKAEQSFEDDPDGVETRDLAYIAERKALAAESDANRILANKRREEALREKERLEVLAHRRTAEELQHTRTALQQREQMLALQDQKLQQKDQALEEERRAREEAEKRAAAALDSLREIASVKEEARGMVITLSGAVLFASGKSTLLAIAKQKLDQVAETLKDQDGNIVVEGHTDSRGPDHKNMELSLARADAVRAYLVSQGVPSDRIRAEGLGESRPVADNNTAEGRANNRRVEIVVQPVKKG